MKLLYKTQTRSMTDASDHCQKMNFNPLKSGLQILSSAFVLSAIALPAQAAIFTVDYVGDVTERFTTADNNRPASPINPPNQPVPFETGLSIVGSYTFDDSTSEVLAARYRYVSLLSGGNIDPSQPDAADTVLSPSPFSSIDEAAKSQADSNGSVSFPLIATAQSKADADSIDYAQITVPFTSSSQVDNLNIGNSVFSTIVQSAFADGRTSDFSYLVTRGNIIATTVRSAEDNGTKDIPEPSAALGLLLTAGLGLSSQLRRNEEGTAEGTAV